MHNAWYVNTGRQGWEAVLICQIRANLQIGSLSDNVLQLCKNTVPKLKAGFLTFGVGVFFLLLKFGFQCYLAYCIYHGYIGFQYVWCNIQEERRTA